MEISPGYGSSVHVNLDLAYKSGYWWWSDPAVDVSFNIRTTCDDGDVKLHATNVNVDVGVYALFVGGFDIQITPRGLVELPSCWDKLEVKESGDIVFGINDVELS